MHSQLITKTQYQLINHRLLKKKHSTHQNVSCQKLIENKKNETLNHNNCFIYNLEHYANIAIINEGEEYQQYSLLLKDAIQGSIIDLKTLHYDYEKYDIIFLQNIKYWSFRKKEHQKFIYIIHNNSESWIIENKEHIIRINIFINAYVFINDKMKELFKKHIFEPTLYYIINTPSNNEKNECKKIQDCDLFKYKYKDLCNIKHELDDKICYVSAITNYYDNFHLFETNKLYYYIFTDNLIDNTKYIHFIHIDNVFFSNQCTGLYKNDKIFDKSTNNMMKAKYIKLNHHLIPELQKYEYTIWIDGRTIVKDPILLKWYVYDMYNNNSLLSLHNHKRWTHIFQDVLYCKNFNNDYEYLKTRYDNQDLIQQMVYYSNNYIDDSNYYECGFIIRNKNHEKIIHLFSTWWKHNIQYSFQDQISFKYLIKLLNINVQSIGNNPYDNAYTFILNHNQNLYKNPPFLIQNGNIMNSWDFWDTLGGRICYEFTGIFDLIEKRLQIPNFKTKRIESENEVNISTNNHFTLEDIYKNLYKKINTPYSIQQLITYEYITEIDMLFLIKENVYKLNGNSIIVSDFFYNKEMFVNLLYIKKLWIHSHNIFVTNAGKHNGTIWQQLLKTCKISDHTGDNKYSDVTHPKLSQYRIKTHHYTNQLLNPYEKFMVNHKYPFFGYIMRSVRLSNPYKNESNEWFLWNLYCNKYIPILFIKIFSLKYLFDLQNTKMVFMSRDGYFLLHIYRAIFPNYSYDYLYISRNAMKQNSQTYINYVKTMVENNVVIDLLGSGKSFYNFTQKHNICHKSYVLFFHKREPVINEITYNEDMKMYSIFNYYNQYIERMNYAVHGSFVEFSDNNKIITKTIEYNISYYNTIYKLINILSNHISKVKDVICDYNLSPTFLYTILHHYYGSNNIFSQKEQYVLNLIGHENEHNSGNVCSDIPYNYFVDLDEYLSLHNL